MDISIFGLGYVGAVSLACLARDGHRVLGVDIDAAKMELIRSGHTPIIEEGMQDLMRTSVESGRVSVTSDVKSALAQTKISFICVGTPSASNGSQDQSALVRLMEQLGTALREKPEHHVFVIRSTVVPGTVEETLCPILEERSGKREGKDFTLCFQPEFLREGTSIKDYDHPPFTIVGVRSPGGASALRELFGHLPCEFYEVGIRTGETVKYFCNIFHALKITFANEVGRLCESFGADPHEIMGLLCKDRQLNISPAYLRPGFAFGGSCLPKDLRAMLHVARGRDLRVPMLEGVLPSNREHVQHAIDKVLATGRRRVGMIGLSFKSGTDDLRESPLVDLAEAFLGKGIDLKIYDPEVKLSRIIGANRRYIEEVIPHIGSLLADRVEDVIDSRDVIVVGLSDRDLIETLRARVQPHQTVLDLVKIPDHKSLGCHYDGACW
ncbi:MAG TPA: nucleotide sugar dehydrogenase [Planctomycetota bacterium]|jgi:GDP-mannose 6-dehydrogenase|nr:nucleotide sugar dehydrogenase [Planctomycetota bacterium]